MKQTICVWAPSTNNPYNRLHCALVFCTAFFPHMSRGALESRGPKTISTLCICVCVSAHEMDRQRLYGCNRWQCSVLCLLNACRWLVSEQLHVTSVAATALNVFAHRNKQPFTHEVGYEWPVNPKPHVLDIGVPDENPHTPGEHETISYHWDSNQWSS